MGMLFVDHGRNVEVDAWRWVVIAEFGDANRRRQWFGDLGDIEVVGSGEYNRLGRDAFVVKPEALVVAVIVIDEEVVDGL
jgi:hypothetical protein